MAPFTAGSLGIIVSPALFGCSCYMKANALVTVYCCFYCCCFCFICCICVALHSAVTECCFIDALQTFYNYWYYLLQKEEMVEEMHGV